MPSSTVCRLTAGAVVPGDFTIEPQFADRYLAITVTGLWNEAIVNRYMTMLRLMTDQMIGRGRYRGALLDASRYPIQPMSVAARHADAMTVARATLGVRASIVMRGEEPKLQMHRITKATGQRLFDDETKALDWLCH